MFEQEDLINLLEGALVEVGVVVLFVAIEVVVVVIIVVLLEFASVRDLIELIDGLGVFLVIILDCLLLLLTGFVFFSGGEHSRGELNQLLCDSTYIL